MYPTSNCDIQYEFEHWNCDKVKNAGDDLNNA